MALLVDAFEEKERADSNGNVSTRSVLCLHPSLAPVKVAILSQNKNKNELAEVSIQLASELRQAGTKYFLISPVVCLVYWPRGLGDTRYDSTVFFTWLR